MSAQSVSEDYVERLLRRFLTLCESPRTQRRMLALVHGSIGSSRTGKRLYALLNRMVLNPVARATGMDASAVRIELVASQLIGVAMMRYVLEIEPIASLDIDELVALLAPSVRESINGRTSRAAARSVEVCSCHSQELVIVPW